MEKGKDIIVFTAGIGNSGIQRVLSELTDAWVNQGHRIRIVYMISGKKSERLEDYGWRQEIELIGVPRGRVLTYVGMFCRYMRILKQNPKAVAVSLSVRTNYLIGFCSFFVKNKILISDRNDPTQRPKGVVKQAFRDFAFKRADVLIFQTEDVQKYYEKRIGRSGLIIPNPINSAISEISPAQSRRPVVVTASRLNAQKNLGMLLQAFRLFSQEHSEYVLEIYGRGEEENNLKKQAEILEISDRVVFKGFSKDLYHDILDAGMYVCSSDYEGISNSLLEALGLGIPAISTDCAVGGSRLLIQDGYNGLLVPVGDIQALYYAMKRIAENPEFANEISIRALSVRETYNIDAIARRWIDSMDIDNT